MIIVPLVNSTLLIIRACKVSNKHHQDCAIRRTSSKHLMSRRLCQHRHCRTEQQREHDENTHSIKRVSRIDSRTVAVQGNGAC